MKYIVDIKGEIEGNYEIIGKYEERPKAKWIWRETGTSICRYGYFTCSNCSFVSKAKQNFCAECGAKMGKVEQNEI